MRFIYFNLLSTINVVVQMNSTSKATKFCNFTT